MKRRIDLKEVNAIVKQELEKNNLQYRLNNLSEDNITIKVRANRRKTILLINRYRHRPFELKITVDYGLTKHKDLVKIKRSNQRQQGSRSMYTQFRFLWFFLIFAGIIISMLYSLIGGFQRLIDGILPGLSSTQQATVVVGTSVAFFLLWMILNPMTRNYFNKKNRSFDKCILRMISERLNTIVDQSETDLLIRCWSCFEVVNASDLTCKHCEKKQN